MEFYVSMFTRRSRFQTNVIIDSNARMIFKKKKKEKKERKLP